MGEMVGVCLEGASPGNYSRVCGGGDPTVKISDFKYLIVEVTGFHCVVPISRGFGKNMWKQLGKFEEILLGIIEKMRRVRERGLLKIHSKHGGGKGTQESNLLYHGIHADSACRISGTMHNQHFKRQL